MQELPSIDRRPVMEVAPGKHSRRVAFTEEPDEVIPSTERSVLTKNGLHTIWYSPEDFKRFRASTRVLASGIRYRQSPDSSNDPVSYTNALSAVYASCSYGCAPTHEDMCALAAWFHIGASRGGLERRSCATSLRREMRSTAASAISNVLQAQTEEWTDSTGKAEHIRKIYKQIAEPARLFALALGNALELSSCADTSTLIHTARGRSIKDIGLTRMYPVTRFTREQVPHKDADSITVSYPRLSNFLLVGDALPR